MKIVVVATMAMLAAPALAQDPGARVREPATANAAQIAEMDAAVSKLRVSVAAVRPAIARLDGMRDLSQLDRLSQLDELKHLDALDGLDGLSGLSGLGALSDLSALGALSGLAELGNIGGVSGRAHGLRTSSRISFPEDAADSLYRLAREALNRDDFKRAADLFHLVSERYPRSRYVPDAMYFEGFALFRSGGEDNLREASDVLRSLRLRYPDATIAGDAGVLLTRINGVLAKQGDANAAEDVAERATGKKGSRGDTKGRSSTGIAAGCPSGDDDDDMRIAALNALLQMDAERAVPILKTVLARRDACSQPLRKKAVFLISQKASEQTADILLDVVRNDPDPEVRGDAVFWMSQVHSDKTLAALESLLHNAKDRQLQDKAIFALSQHDSPQAMKLLRDFAMSPDVSDEARGQAIFWIGQGHRSPENAKFLRELYGKLTSDDLRDKIIHGVAESGGEEDRQWLVELVRDSKQPAEARKKAIFWLGQQRRTSVSDINRMYDSIKDQEIREQVIFALSQRRETAAVDKLIEIAKTDTNRELRKKAIFWLGQSNDPRVKQLLLELINQ